MKPREKFLTNGIDSLSNEELIAIIISNGVKGYNFRTVSRSVYRVLQASVSQGRSVFIELNKVSGIGEVKAMQISCGIELGKRVFDLEKGRKERILNTQEAWNSLKYLGKYKSERLVSVYLNGRYEILGKRTISIGTVNRISASPRDILAPALELNGVYILIAHNHPSGDCTPSVEDISFTKGLSKACDIVGLKLLDHIIITDSTWSRVDFQT